MASRCGRLVAIIVAAAVAIAVFAGRASAAQLIARNAQHVQLRINGDGVALITYTNGGQVSHVLARGAINAHYPRSKSRPQESFQLDYSGGQKFFGKPVWSGFGGSCGRYDGPKLYGMVVACKAPDGSYWALQSWQQALPDLGFTPWTDEQRASWLELSHWTGPLAQLDVWQGWAQKHDNAIFGTYTYKGSPIYGFGTTSTGVPTDAYGRLVYLDTLNSTYARGWIRENSFVSRGPSGEFCYALIVRNPRVGGYQIPPGLPPGVSRGPGVGSRYRVVAEGPGVTPLVEWEDSAFRSYDPTNPGDIAAYMHNRTRLEALGKGNSCLQGQFVPPGGFKLAKVTDDFQGPELSAVWSRPETIGGATLGVGSGLRLALPAGEITSTSVTTERWVDAKGSPAFIDLGPAGIPAAATFEMLLASPQNDYLHRYEGLRIAAGRLSVVGSAADGGSVAYDPAQARWLLIWIRNNQLEVWYAATPDGTWSQVGRLPALWNSNTGGLLLPHLSLRVEGDGTRSASVSILSLSK